MQNYLSEIKQRTKINQGYSFWKEIYFGVTQGSILVPIDCHVNHLCNKADKKLRELVELHRL